MAIALKQKSDEEERIREENRRIKEWEDKFDQEQKKKEQSGVMFQGKLW